MYTKAPCQFSTQPYHPWNHTSWNCGYFFVIDKQRLPGCLSTWTICHKRLTLLPTPLSSKVNGVVLIPSLWCQCKIWYELIAIFSIDVMPIYGHIYKICRICDCVWWMCNALVNEPLKSYNGLYRPTETSLVEKPAYHAAAAAAQSPQPTIQGSITIIPCMSIIPNVHGLCYNIHLSIRTCQTWKN